MHVHRAWSKRAENEKSSRFQSLTLNTSSTITFLLFLMPSTLEMVTNCKNIDKLLLPNWHLSCAFSDYSFDSHNTCNQNTCNIYLIFKKNWIFFLILYIYFKFMKFTLKNSIGNFRFPFQLSGSNAPRIPPGLGTRVPREGLQGLFAIYVQHHRS